MYIEIIILFNFLLDFMILYGTKRLLKLRTKWKRMVISALLGSISTLLFFIKIPILLWNGLKLLISILMILLSFGKKQLLRNLFYFYMISIQIGGLIYLLDWENNVTFQYIMIFISTVFFIIILKKEINQWKNQLSNKYIVKITYQKKEYILEGFIDTGNKLESLFQKKSIILVNMNLKYDKILYIPYKALNTEGILPCIKPDKIIINNKRIDNCLLGLSKNKLEIGEYHCILPNQLKEELC